MLDTQVTKAPPSLLYMVKQVELVVRSHLDELVRPSGITALQYTALTVLERHDGLSAAQLARDSFVTAQSIADLVRSLETRGLIRRERNPKNRRELLILLTEEGARCSHSTRAPCGSWRSGWCGTSPRTRPSSSVKR